jgi:hypothetical protein
MVRKDGTAPSFIPNLILRESCDEESVVVFVESRRRISGIWNRTDPSPPAQDDSAGKHLAMFS